MSIWHNQSDRDSSGSGIFWCFCLFILLWLDRKNKIYSHRTTQKDLSSLVQSGYLSSLSYLKVLFKFMFYARTTEAFSQSSLQFCFGHSSSLWLLFAHHLPLHPASVKLLCPAKPGTGRKTKSLNILTSPFPAFWARVLLLDHRKTLGANAWAFLWIEDRCGAHNNLFSAELWWIGLRTEP